MIDRILKGAGIGTIVWIVIYIFLITTPPTTRPNGARCGCTPTMKPGANTSHHRAVASRLAYRQQANT